MRASYRRARRHGRACAAALALGLAGAGPALAQAPTPLPDVEVRAGRGSGGTVTLPLAVTVLDSLPRVAGQAAVAGLLRGVPGVVAVDQGNPAVDERLAIRGFGSRSAFGVRGVAVLLDGVPQTLPDGQGQLTDLDPLEPTIMEVVRGGASTLHGNAAGGVVASRTTLVEGPPAVVLSAGAGSFGARRIGGDAALMAGGWRLAGGGSTSERDGWRDHSTGTSHRARLGVAGSLGGVTLRGFLRFTDQPDAQNPGGLTAAEVERDPTAAAPGNVAANARKSVRQWQAAATAETDVGASTSGRATVYGLTRAVDNPLAFGTILLERNTGGARVEVRHAMPGALRPRIVAGLDAQWMRDERQNRSPAGATTLEQVDRVRGLAPFALARLQVAPTWLLTTGLRWDQVRFEVDDRFGADGDASGTRTMGQLSPSLGVTWLASGRVAAWAGLRSSFESPTTTELVNRPDGTDGLSAALEPQTAWHLEVGARGAVPFASWEVTAWMARVEDLLVPFEDPAQPGRRFYRNAGQAGLAGVELSGRWAPLSELSLDAAWALTDGNYRSFAVDGVSYDGNALPGVPLHRAALTATGHGPAGLSGALDLTASSGLWVDDANSARSDGWFTADLRLWWRGPGGIEPWLSVRNLLDAATVPSVIVNAAAGRFYEPGPGRGVEVGVTYRQR